MRVSIITIVRNDPEGIIKTIESVSRQTHPDIEYIVVDGASTDQTLENIRSRMQSIDVLISEPDAGISDAWNKGIAQASGEIIGILNAADEYEDNAVALAVAKIAQGYDIVYGNTDLVDREGNLIRRCHGRFSRWFYSAGIGFHHPSLFARTQVYQTIGSFNIKLRLAMDSDWIFRAYKSGAKFGRSNHRVRMEAGGISAQNRFSAWGEHLDSMCRSETPSGFVSLNIVMTGLRFLASSVIRR